MGQRSQLSTWFPFLPLLLLTINRAKERERGRERRSRALMILFTRLPLLPDLLPSSRSLSLSLLISLSRHINSARRRRCEEKAKAMSEGGRKREAEANADADATTHGLSLSPCLACEASIWSAIHSASDLRSVSLAVERVTDGPASPLCLLHWRSPLANTLLKETDLRIQLSPLAPFFLLTIRVPLFSVTGLRTVIMKNHCSSKRVTRLP